MKKIKQPYLSVVIPVFKSQESLDELIRRTIVILQKINRSSEVICIDDESPDRSWQVLLRLKKQFPKLLKIARLTKNFGQHNAILCGMSLAEGEVIITMDDDLQNPPEEIPKLVAAIENGFDLCVGSYLSKKHDIVRNVSGGLVDKVIRSIFGLPKNFQLTSFRAVRRHVVLSVKQMGGVYPYVTAMMLSHASRYTNVEVRHDPRKHGVTNYNLGRSVRLAGNLLLSYSTLPVKMVGFACFIAFAFSLLFGTFVLFRALLEGAAVQGWASTVVILTFFNALILLCLFVFSIYLSRMSRQLARSRTCFTIAEFNND